MGREIGNGQLKDGEDENLAGIDQLDVEIGALCPVLSGIGGRAENRPIPGRKSVGSEIRPNLGGKRAESPFSGATR